LGIVLASTSHIMSGSGRPDTSDLALGVDVIAGAIVMQIAFIPGSHGEEASLRWGGVLVLCWILLAMVVHTRFYGWERGTIYSAPGNAEYVLTFEIKPRVAIVTTSISCAILCLFWWLNVNVELFMRVWKELSH